MANMVTENDGRIIRLEEKCEMFKSRLDDLEELEDIVRDLEQQAIVLKWLTGVVSTLAVGLFIKLF